MLLIKKEEIPNWDKGDVMIKGFSFGDKTKLAGMASKDMKNGELSEDADVAEYSLFMLAAGTLWIKLSDNIGMFVDVGMTVEDKKKKVYDLDFESGVFILNRIKDLNKPLTQEEKKN